MLLRGVFMLNLNPKEISGAVKEFCEIEKRSSVREKTEERLCLNGAAFVCQNCTVLQKRMGIMYCAVPSFYDRCCIR